MITLDDLAMPVADGRTEPVSRRFRLWLEATFLQVHERMKPTPVQTSAYTARPWDYVWVDPTAGAFAVTLPLRARSGDVVEGKNAGTSVNAVTYIAATGDTIDGAASVANITSRGSERFTYDARRRDWGRRV